MDKRRPVLKWAGNKFRVLHKIIPELPKGSRLIEPFTGSAAVFLNTNFPSALLAEANPDLINLFSHIQKEGQSFINFCKTYFRPETNQKTFYYQFRDTFNTTENLKEKAALFLYLNRHGYNGLCRYNSSGGFNVPFGTSPKSYFPEEEMIYFHNKSQHATLMVGDFVKTFKMAKPGDIIYCDPPYVPLSKTSDFTSYTSKEFSEANQIKLAELARAAAKKGMATLISNHDTPFTQSLYKGARIKSFPVNRFITCKADGRRPVTELLATFLP